MISPSLERAFRTAFGRGRAPHRGLGSVGPRLRWRQIASGYSAASPGLPGAGVVRTTHLQVDARSSARSGANLRRDQGPDVPVFRPGLAAADRVTGLEGMGHLLRPPNPVL